MATTVLTRGYAKWVQGAGTKIYDNATGQNAEGDWSWYLGRKHWDYTNDFCAAVVAFTVPSIIDSTFNTRTITIPITSTYDSGNITSLYAQLSTTAPTDYTSFNNGAKSGAISNEVTWNQSTTSLSFAINNGVAISGTTIYLYLYVKSDAEHYTVTVTNVGDGALIEHDYTFGYGTVISQSHYNGGWLDYGLDRTSYAGTNYSNFYTYILKFTAPTFTGVSEKLTVKLGMTKSATDSATLRYALCTSDANKDSYVNTNSEVADSNQISSSTVTLSGLSTVVTYHDIVIPTTNIQSGNTYYLFLWGYVAEGGQSYVKVNNVSYHTITLNYNSGVIYIDNGTGWDAYQVYIDNGSGWDICG